MFKSKKFQTKSPVKDNPLRYPGQSVHEQQFDVIFSDFMPYLLASVIFCLMAGLQWFYYYIPIKNPPVLFSILAAVFLIFSIYRIRMAAKKIIFLRQGRRGEQVVGQYLDGFRGDNARVLHDIPCDNFNIDHVIIHEKGIYLIETKTYSKPVKGEPIITYDGKNVFMNGIKTKTDAVKQAQISSSWLQKEILKTTGKKIYVKPVVVFPGWMTKKTTDYQTSDVWVLNPKSLKSFIDKQKDQLAHADVRQVYSQLSKYVRTKVGEMYEKGK